MTERSTLGLSGDRRCDFCIRPARFHFGTDGWKVPVGNAMGQRFVAGQTIHACGDCALRLRRWADKQADAEAWRELMTRGR